MIKKPPTVHFHELRIRHLPLWLMGYVIFIIFAIFLSYYLNTLPPSSSKLTNAYYFADEVDLPLELKVDTATRVELPDMETAEQGVRKEGWYKIVVPANHLELTDQRLCIYLPMVNQNVEVFLNDRWLGNGGRMESPIDRNYNNPLIFNFSKNDLAPNHNAFYIHVKGLLPRWTYLGEVYVASEATLKPIYEKQKLLRVNLVIFTSIALMFTSLFTALLWLLRRKKAELYYLWYSLAELLWAIHDTNLFIKRIPVSDVVWESLVSLSIGWSILCFLFFIHRYTGQYNVNTDRMIFFLGVLFTLPFAYQDFNWVVFYGYQAWLLFVLIVGLYAVIFMLKRYINTRDQNILVMLLASGVMIAFGVHDLLATQAILPPSSPYIMSISALLIILVISTLLIRRFVASLDVVEHYNESLQKQVQLKESQLKQEYQKTQKLQKQQILNNERERIMRDIHDGIGGQLVSTLAAIESPDATMTQVRDNLKIALQDLRLVIDSLDGDSQDLIMILGTLRTRLEALLLQANIKLIWKVQDLPILEEFGPEKALNTMRIVQEAITNVIKHSGASQLTMSAYPEVIEGKEVVVVSVVDNGCGIKQIPNLTGGRGMLNMRSRAASIDAQIAIKNNAPTGALITLTFNTNICLPT